MGTHQFATATDERTGTYFLTNEVEEADVTEKPKPKRKPKPKAKPKAKAKRPKPKPKRNRSRRGTK